MSDKSEWNGGTIQQPPCSALSGQTSWCSGSKCVLTGTSRDSYWSSVLIPGAHLKAKSPKAPEPADPSLPPHLWNKKLRHSVITARPLIAYQKGFNLHLTFIPLEKLPVKNNIFYKAATKGKHEEQTETANKELVCFSCKTCASAQHVILQNGFRIPHTPKLIDLRACCSYTWRTLCQQSQSEKVSYDP